MSREFQIFVKPAGALCNLRCSYCYYLGKKDLYQDTDSFRMNDETLERYIIQHIEASTDDVILFSWHGGEPILAGLDFYQKAVAIQKKCLPAGRTVINGIQTNGTLLDKEWCDFLASENFIAGISIDGPEEFHNSHRLYPDGRGSFAQAIRGYELLKKHGVTTEILCVLNSHNAGYPLEIYNFFRLMEARYITFLPLVERMPGVSSGVSPSSVSAEEYGRFLCTVFDSWVENDIGRISIQIFEEAARTAFNREHTLCIFKVNCGGVPVIEHNGDFYSCDHYVDKDHLIGNINHNSLSSFLDSPAQKAFGEAKSIDSPKILQRVSRKRDV